MAPKIAFIDAFSGVAGDMLLAGALDAGASLQEVQAGLESLGAIEGEWSIAATRVTRSSIAALHVKVTSIHGDKPAPTPGSHSRHDHSHDHNHSHNDHNHDHSHDSHSHHDHSHGSSDEATLQPLRGLAEISALISASSLPDSVKSTSIAVFSALADAEAWVHGTTPDQVHFHEVGAIDSIIDTVGCVLAFHLLGVERVYCTPLPYSEGAVNTAHGLLPVPAPATLRLLLGVPTRPGPKGATGELVTPTGAALVRVLSQGFGRPPVGFRPLAIGVGAGTKDFQGHPNVLRVVLGDLDDAGDASLAAAVPELPSALTPWSSQKLCVLEANTDDMTGEQTAHVIERAMAAGALDAWTTAIVMKKGRPALTLHVLCNPAEEAALLLLLFRESTTLGVRRTKMERAALERRTETVSTQYGSVRVKVALLSGNEVVNLKPEFDDCKALAEATGASLQAVTQSALAAALAVERTGS